jgi:hypothetical protein
MMDDDEYEADGGISGRGNCNSPNGITNIFEY